MRVREILEGAGVASMAAEPIMAPVKQAVKTAVNKGVNAVANTAKEFVKSEPYGKGVSGAVDNAFDATGYAQGTNMLAPKSPVDFAVDQAGQRAIGTGVEMAGKKAVQSLAAKGIETGAKTWLPRAAAYAGPMIKTGTGAVGTGAALALHSPDLGPREIPKWGPERGTEINRATGAPWTQQDLDKYHADTPDQRGLWDRLTSEE